MQKYDSTTSPNPFIFGSKGYRYLWDLWENTRQADKAGRADTTVKLANRLQHGDAHHPMGNEKAHYARDAGLGKSSLNQVKEGGRFLEC